MSSPLTREEFAAAVRDAITGVQHLYREVDLLLAGLRQHLGEPPAPLEKVRGTSGKSGKGAMGANVRFSIGALFRAADLVHDADEDADGQDDGDGIEGGDPDADGPRRGVIHEISTDQRLLAIRVVLHDPAVGTSFEPHLTFAVLSDWSVGGVKQGQGETFSLRADMLKRIPLSLAGPVDAHVGRPLVTGAVAERTPGRRRSHERTVSCLLPQGAESVLLHELNSAGALASVATRMRAMWISR